MYINDSSDDDLNTKENDYDETSIESIKSKNTNDAMQTIDGSQVTDITVSTVIIHLIMPQFLLTLR